MCLDYVLSMDLKVKMNYVEFIALLIVLEFAICNGKFLKIALH